MRIAFRLLIAVLPLALSFLFGYLLTGPLSLGGGEKDILLAIPALAWSVLYLACSLFFWAHRRPLLWSFGIAASVATVLLLVAFLALFLVSVVA
jgi:hypothetical protein